MVRASATNDSISLAPKPRSATAPPSVTIGSSTLAIRRGETNFRHRFSFLAKLVFMFMSELRQYARVGAVRCADRREAGSANNSSWFSHIIRCNIRPKGGVFPETVLNRIVVVPAGFLARREIGR